MTFFMFSHYFGKYLLLPVPNCWRHYNTMYITTHLCTSPLMFEHYNYSTIEVNYNVTFDYCNCYIRVSRN